MGDSSHIVPDWTTYIEYSKRLSQDEMIIREKVVLEYLYDYNWTKACLRCGFRPEFASDNAERFSRDPYCMWRVKELARERGISATPEEKEEKLDQDRIDIMNALKKEAHYYGPGSSQAARVSALGKLAQLLGMEPAKKVKAEVANTGVMVVPGIADTSDWEAVASEQQQKLQEDTFAAINRGNDGNENYH